MICKTDGPEDYIQLMFSVFFTYKRRHVCFTGTAWFLDRARKPEESILKQSRENRRLEDTKKISKRLIEETSLFCGLWG